MFVEKYSKTEKTNLYFFTIIKCNTLKMAVNVQKFGNLATDLSYI